MKLKGKSIDSELIVHLMNMAERLTEGLMAVKPTASLLSTATLRALSLPFPESFLTTAVKVYLECYCFIIRAESHPDIDIKH